MAPITAECSGANTPNRFSSKPSQSSGRVMLSGSSWVSKSMKVKDTRNQVRTSAASPAAVAPRCQMASPLNSAVASSIDG